MENIIIDTIKFEEPIKAEFENFKDMFDSHHYQDCCESHYLDFDSYESDFELVEKLELIDKIDINGSPWIWVTIFFYNWEDRAWVFFAWRGYNNGYYSSNIDFIVTLPNGFKKEYDVSEYQDIED